MFDNLLDLFQKVPHLLTLIKLSQLSLIIALLFLNLEGVQQEK